MTAKITIREVAAAAGVALKTVSRVLNDEPNVTAPVRERVKKAVEDLGYVPSMAARRMGGTRSYLLVSFNDRAHTINNWSSGRGNDWLDQMLYGAILACEARGYRMMFELIDPASDQWERQVSAVLSAQQPDGVILTPPHSESRAMKELLQRRNVPFACLGGKGEGLGAGVRMDDRAAAEEATRHLIETGRRRIGFIGGPARFEVSAARREGYRAALTAAGWTIEQGLEVEGDFTFDSGVTAAEVLLGQDRPPDAILASNDEMALAVLHVAHRRGLAAPGDLAVISFDDTPGVRLSLPPLTAVRQPIAAMAARASELLIEMARGAAIPDEDQFVPYELVARASTTGG